MLVQHTTCEIVPAATPHHETVLDTSLLEQLLPNDAEGAAALVQELLALHREVTDSGLTTIEQANSAGNWMEIKHSVHSMKGACQSLGAVLMASLCLQLESVSERQDAAIVSDLVARLRAAHHQVCDALESFAHAVR